MKTDRILILVVFLALSVAARAQAPTTVQVPQGTSSSSTEPQATQPPKAPTPQPASWKVFTYGDYDWLIRAGVACGGGVSDSSAATKPTWQCGGIFGLSFLDIEAGAMGPTARHNAVSGYLSTNLWIPLPWRNVGNKHGVPIALGGYTQMFGTSNALNYGVAYAYPVSANHSVQLEARDYWTIASPSQHNVVFRLAWLVCIPDP